MSKTGALPDETDEPKQDDSIIAKLSRIQARLIVGKGQWNDFSNFNYRSCSDILEALKPHLEREGCAIHLTDEIVLVGDRIYVKSTASFCKVKQGLVGESPIESEAFAREPLVKKGMDESQITGSCSSYARKYALNGLFCIDDTKDADTMDNRMSRAEADDDASEVTETPEQAKLSADAAIQKLLKARGYDGPTLRKAIEAEFKTDYDKMTPAQLMDAVDWANTGYTPKPGDTVGGPIPGTVT